MNMFNRVVLVLISLLLMVVLTVSFMYPQGVLISVGEWLKYGGEFFGQQKSLVRIGGGLTLSLIVDAVLAFLIFLELRPQRKRSIRVQQVAGGMVTINDTSITQQIAYKLDPIAGVITVKPQIRAKGDKVKATVQVEVGANVNVPRMATLLMERVQKVLAEDLGLQVYGQPEVQIKVAPSPTKLPPEPEPPPLTEPRPSSPPPLPLMEPSTEERRRRIAEAEQSESSEV
ncbi:MAG: hypothetical protein JXA21_26240 [Anaerolineae bacterium]|nr:hypothetical protein [Anaerolineae bacterium]